MNFEIASVNKPLSIVSAHADGPEFSALDRRLFNVLFYNAYQKIQNDFRQAYEVHEINMADLQNFLEQDRGAIHESLQRLWGVKITIQYQDTENNQSYTTYGHYLSYQVPNDNVGVLSYMFDKFIIRFMNFNQIYAPIELGVSNQLKSTFSHRLYEAMSSQWRKFNPVWQISIEEARTWFEVGDNYQRFDKFKAGVIETAIKEVNLHAPFSVNVEYIKAGLGGKVVALKFTADPEVRGENYRGILKPKHVAFRDGNTRDMFDGLLDTDRVNPPAISRETWDEAVKIVGPDADLEALRLKWFKQAGAHAHSNPDASFRAYLMVFANAEAAAAPVVHEDIDVEMMFNDMMGGKR